MILINHRVNTAEALTNVPTENGVEIDLRSNCEHSGSLILGHDPWGRGEDFEKWLSVFKQRNIQGALIINTKEDGLEQGILKLLNKFDIKNYFFLDTTYPTLLKWVLKEKNSKFAVRMSAYEGIENALRLSGKVDWCWIDCFDGVPLSEELVRKVGGHFRLCLVSPELHGCDVSFIPQFKAIAKQCNAVCTKFPELWKSG